MSYGETDERLAAVESNVRELELVPQDVALAGEAVRIMRGILSDLIDASNVDRSEYVDDLARLDTIGSLLL